MKLVSDPYKKLLEDLHLSSRKGFGGKVKPLKQLAEYLEQWKPKTFLDYGCGKGAMLESIAASYPNMKCTGYDPGWGRYRRMPEGKFECVMCVDVLEHVEPKFLDNVLKHINQLSTKYIWICVDTIPAKKKLVDGRNAHLIIKHNWWIIEKLQALDGEFIFEHFSEIKGKYYVAIDKTSTR